MNGTVLFWFVFLHFLGDYALQSDWMATEKTVKWWPTVVHSVVYGLPFLALTRSPLALLAIIGTHAVIDHYRLARYVVWAKNFIAPRSAWPPPFRECSKTGYPPERDNWLATWLMIIVDNAAHLAINFLAVMYL